MLTNLSRMIARAPPCDVVIVRTRSTPVGVGVHGLGPEQNRNGLRSTICSSPPATRFALMLIAVLWLVETAKSDSGGYALAPLTWIEAWVPATLVGNSSRSPSKTP